LGWETIKARVLAINAADDERDPVELTSAGLDSATVNKLVKP